MRNTLGGTSRVAGLFAGLLAMAPSGNASAEPRDEERRRIQPSQVQPPVHQAPAPNQVRQPQQIQPQHQAPVQVRQQPQFQPPAQVRQQPQYQSPAQVRQQPQYQSPAQVRQQPQYQSPAQVQQPQSPAQVRQQPQYQSPAQVRQQPQYQPPAQVQQPQSPAQVRQQPQYQPPAQVHQQPPPQMGHHDPAQVSPEQHARPLAVEPGSQRPSTNNAWNRPAYTLPAEHQGGRPEALRPQDAHSVLTQVNSSRATMHGVNAKPLPHGNVFVRPEGGLRVEASGDRHFGVRPNGSVASFTSPHHSATFRPDGHVATLHSGPLRVSHAAGGGRVVFRERPDHTTVVSVGPHFGYVQRPVFVHNAHYVQRTYVRDNLVFTRAYAPYSYQGVVIYRYAPSVYYAPAYYRWAYRPWARPVPYTWGWYSSPWRRYYAGYFTPMPIYPAPSYWLADYLIAAALEEAFLSRPSAPPPEYAASSQPPPAAPITPAVREAIALEVQRQLEEERANAEAYRQPVAEAAPAPSEEASPPPVLSAPPAFLQQPGRIFVASTALDVLVNEQACGLSPGDVLRLDAPVPNGAQTAALRVLSSKPGDCAAGSEAVLSVNDLQEMYNHFHEKVDSGLGQMKTSQSAGQMPPAPPDAQAVVAGPGAAAGAPVANAAETIDEAQRGADQAEAELGQEMADENGPN